MTPERLHPTITMFTDPSGNYCLYEFNAAGGWRNSDPDPTKGPVLLPDRADSPTALAHKLIAEYPDGRHVFLYYWLGRFRQASGNPQAQPTRWAYLNLTETPTVAVPRPHVPLSTGEWAQDMVNILLKHCKRSEVLNRLDRSPYNNPKEGVPE